MASEQATAIRQDEAAEAGATVLQGRYGVYPDKPLPEFDTPSAKAFAAADRRDPQRALFALICRPDLPPRTNVMRSLKGVQSAGLLPLIEWGCAPWAPAGRQCMMVVYERPAGGRVMAGPGAELRRYDDWEVSKKLVGPLTAALRELTARGVSHRAIRLTNMFYMGVDRETIVLGDCATAPAGLDQPVLFETIEHGMAHPAGRGSGRYDDDMYSLGVSLVLLLLGRNPVAEMSDEALLHRKVAAGSYAALVGEERLPLASIEVLRGLLCDDPAERWTIESLDLWLSGRRLSPLQAKLPKRAERSFPFNGKEYSAARDLGMALAKHWDAAIPVVLDGKLELWLRRALGDRDRADGVAAAVSNATGALGDSRAAAAAMLAKVCMVLDPTAPIRYKGLHVMPDGFGPLLAWMMAGRHDPRLLAECLLREVPKLWLGEREGYSPENTMLAATYRELRDQLRIPATGHGLERCLYLLNETLPLQSGLVAEEYVIDIKQLLPALDGAARRADTKAWPFDRHVVAFLVSHLNYDVGRQLQALSDDDPAMAALGMLNLLAILQWRLGPAELYGLTGWVGGLLGPVISSYHSRELRAELEAEIPRLVRQGSLLALYRYVDNAEQRQADAEGFARAQREWAAAEQEIADLDSASEAREARALRLGQQSAAIVSVLIGLATLTVVTLMELW